jgi:GT2 family glycosyltransferase
MQPTKEYLEQMSKKYDNITLVRHSRNIGFIIPNNKLAKLGISPYIILLNSDTVVSKGWDSALIGVLNAYPNCGIIGFQGGTLEIDGKGCGGSLNGKIDYVCGWCLCIKRILYEKFGLFDEDNLKFAYGEDSDLSLRMKEEGFDIHAMNIKLVKHYGNVTSMEVNKEMDISATFKKNHEYIRERWKDYLMYKRVALTP